MNPPSESYSLCHVYWAYWLGAFLRCGCLSHSSKCSSDRSLTQQSKVYFSEDLMEFRTIRIRLEDQAQSFKVFDNPMAGLCISVVAVTEVDISVKNFNPRTRYMLLNKVHVRTVGSGHHRSWLRSWVGLWEWRGCRLVCTHKGGRSGKEHCC